jgi:flavin-dependent dehydrogenase
MTGSGMSGLYDVVIAGAGPAGAAAATHLARSGCTVLMADAGPARRFPMGETLPPDAIRELCGLGCSDSFLDDGHPRSQGMCSFWGSAIAQFRDSFASPAGAGWILDRPRFEEQLRAHAQRAGVRVHRRTRVVSAVPGRKFWTVGLRSPGRELSVRARFLVDATGRSASLARALGARRRSFDRLAAVYACFPCDAHASGGMSTIASSREGWWYGAGVPDGRMAVGLFSDSDLLRARDLASPVTWLKLLRASPLGDRIVPADERELQLKACSAASQMVECGGDRWLAVGDAACCWDPLASAGITMGLRTGIEASHAIQASLSGDPLAAVHYARRIFTRTRHYLTERAFQYSAETRWTEEPFWKRRALDAAVPFAVSVPL